MVKGTDGQPSTAASPQSPGETASDPATGAQASAQASIDGLTGRYLVLLEPDKTREAERALKGSASISMDHVQAGDDTPIGARSIDEGRGLVFPALGVAVVNPARDQISNVSSAVARSEDMIEMEPERFIYALGQFDPAYLRGFRDAVNHLYDKFTEADERLGVIGGAAFTNTDQLAWGLLATRVNSSAETGRGVRIAVLDTGIDLTHPDFQGRAVLPKSFVEGETYDDGHGHGTHCAGIACGPKQPRSLPRFGVAHDAELLVAKVLANSGRGTDSSILAGIQWAMSEGAQVISMSLGGAVLASQNYSRVFQQVGERAIQQGTLIIAAAGNDSNRARGKLEAVSHPANCPAIMAVGAVDRDLRIAPFSNAGINVNGGKVDIVAPGVDIVSTWPGTLQYKSLDGTSMATPHVAGIAALYAQRYPNLRGDALWARLLQQAQPLSAPARDVGAGLVQAPQ